MRSTSSHWRLLWLAIGAVAGVTGIFMHRHGLRIDAASALPSAYVVAGLFVIWAGYGYVRPDERLAALGMGGIVLICYTNVGAAFSYAATATGWPALDAEMAALDRYLGFDWLTSLAWTGAHHWIAKPLLLVYFTSIHQVIAVVVVLALAGQISRLIGFIWVFVGTSVLIISLSVMFPAVGAFTYFDPPAELRAGVGATTGTWHVQHFNELRQGTMTVIDLMKLEGLVQFPSFHTALAIACAWGLWTVRWARWPVVVWSVLIIASTLGIGGHYLIDLIAGALVAAAVIVLAPRAAEISAHAATEEPQRIASAAQKV